MVNRHRLIRTEVNFTQAATEPVWVITATALTALTAPDGAVASTEDERPPLANAMFGAAKISIDHIDRHIRLRSFIVIYRDIPPWNMIFCLFHISITL